VVDALFPSSAKSAPLPSPAVSLCLSIDIRIEFLQRMLSVYNAVSVCTSILDNISPRRPSLV
jgi:hypothetical protein